MFHSLSPAWRIIPILAILATAACTDSGERGVATNLRPIEKAAHDGTANADEPLSVAYTLSGRKNRATLPPDAGFRSMGSDEVIRAFEKTTDPTFTGHYEIFYFNEK